MGAGVPAVSASLSSGVENKRQRSQHWVALGYHDTLQGVPGRHLNGGAVKEKQGQSGEISPFLTPPHSCHFRRIMITRNQAAHVQHTFRVVCTRHTLVLLMILT